MPPSDDSIDDSKPLRGKLRKGSDSSSLEEDEVAIGKLGKKPSGDDLVAIGQLTKRFGGSVGDIDRQVRGYLRKRQGATPSDQEVSRFIADLDKNPSDLEAIEGWIGEETLFRWLDQMRGQDEVRRFDFAVAVATLMCLRWLEVHDEESRAIAEFEEDNYESCLDPKNAIREWARFGLEELSDFIKAEVILGLQNAEGPEYAIYAARLVPGLQIFARLRPMMQQALLQRMTLIDPLTTQGRRSGRLLLAALLRWLVKNEGGYAGEFYTPETVTDLMVSLADPSPGERIYDPCFGTGCLLAGAARRMMEKAKTTDTESWSQIRHNGIYGRELNDRVFILGLARLVYEGVDMPRLAVGNSLEIEGFNGQSDSGYDCVLANPPFGLRVDESFGHQFPIPMKEGDGLFIQHVVQSLRPGGRAVVMAAPSILSRGGRMMRLREQLVMKSGLEKVIALPKGILAPYTSIGACILVFRRDQPTGKVEFINLRKTEPHHDWKGRDEVEEYLRKSDQSYVYEQTTEEIANREWDLTVRDASAHDFDQQIEDLRERFGDLEIMRLSKVAKIKAGSRYGKKNTTSEKPADGPVVGLLRVGDLAKGAIEEPEKCLANVGTAAWINRNGRWKGPTPLDKGHPEEELLRGKVFLSEGDLLLSNSGTVGKTAVYQAKEEGFDRLAIGTGIVRLRPEKQILSRDYLFSLLQSEAYQNWMVAHARGSTAREHLSLTDLRALPVPVPPINIQDRVARHATEEKGDAFAFLQRVLSDKGEDPFLSWLESSPELGALISYASEGTEQDRLLVIQDAAASICRERNRLNHEPKQSPSKSAQELSGWLSMVSGASGKLRSIVRIENQEERFNLLYHAAVQSGAAEFVIPRTHQLASIGIALKGESSAAKRASKVSQSFEEVLRWEIASINKQQSLDLDCADVVPMDAPTEVTIDLSNYGPLPLREVEITDMFGGDGVSIPYLGVGGDFSFEHPVDPQAYSELEGKLCLTFLLRATRMDDTSFETDLPLAIEIQSPEMLRDFDFSDPTLDRLRREYFLTYEEASALAEAASRGLNFDLDQVVSLSEAASKIYRDSNIEGVREKAKQALTEIDNLIRAIVTRGKLQKTTDSSPLEQTIKLEKYLDTAVGLFDEAVLEAVRHAREKRVVSNESALDERTLDAGPVEESPTEEDIGYSPYSAGNPVPDMLFGRERLLQRIYRQLGKPGHTNVIILEGNRRYGKSSILKRLEREEKTQDWLVVYVDCQKGEGHATIEGLPTEEVWRSFAQTLGEKLIGKEIDFRLPGGGAFGNEGSRQIQLRLDCQSAFSNKRPFQVFEGFLKQAVQAVAPKRILFLLDEFDKLQVGVDNKVTSPDVFSNLRHLVHNLEEFSIIIAGTPLLKHLQQEHWSALYGFGVNMPVSFLAEADVRDLIVSPVKGRVRYTESAIKEIFRITAGQPYLVQYLCNQLFENLADDPAENRTVSIEHVKSAAREFIAAGQHFNDLWGYAGSERSRLILATTQRFDESDSLLTLPILNEEMVERGIRLPKGHKLARDVEYLRNLELLQSKRRGNVEYYTLQIPLFGDWIQYHHPFDEVVELAREEARNQDDD